MNKFGEVSGDGELEIHKNTVIQVRNPIAIHVLKYINLGWLLYLNDIILFAYCSVLVIRSHQSKLINSENFQILCLSSDLDEIWYGANIGQ